MTIEETAHDREEAVEVLAQDAYRFLMSGGRLTREEWSELDPVHRDAFVAAGEAVAEFHATSLAVGLIEELNAIVSDHYAERALRKAVGSGA